jgi:hypothetical protein
VAGGSVLQSDVAAPPIELETPPQELAVDVRPMAFRSIGGLAKAAPKLTRATQLTRSGPEEDRGVAPGIGRRACAVRIFRG